MSLNSAVNELYKYLDNLTATNPVCDSFGLTLTGGANLFKWQEPLLNTATQMITIIPYSGSPPRPREKQESSVQIRVKAKTNRTAADTSQALINTLDRNIGVCASKVGIVLANQSNPFFLPDQEGGEWKIAVSNYTIRHAKF